MGLSAGRFMGVPQKVSAAEPPCPNFIDLA
jgi:hypothetical protein